MTASSPQELLNPPKRYLFLFLTVFAALILISLGYTWHIYHARTELKNQYLAKEASRVSRELAASFDYATRLMTFFGEQIAKDGAHDVSKIVELLRSDLTTGPVEREHFSWLRFNWETPDHQMVASTMYGILPEPKDVSYRHYAKMALREPWKLHFDVADMGISNNEGVIPAGMGIVDTKGTLLGILSIGFNIRNVSQVIEKVIDNKESRFAVIDEEGRLAFYSPDNTIEALKPEILKAMLDSLPASKREGFLPAPFTSEHIRYSYYQKLEGYPYTILLGYDETLVSQSLKETLFPGISSIIALCLIAFAFFIMGLLIAGKEKLIKQLKEERQKLQDKLAILKASDHEKEHFLQDIYKTLREPLLMIQKAAKTASHQPLKTIEAYQEYFVLIQRAASELLTYTPSALRFSRIDIEEVIEKVVTIQQKNAEENTLTITTHIEENLPPIMADKLRLQQILLSTLYESMLFTQAEGKIHISVIKQQNKETNEHTLVLRVKDNGMGLNEEERAEFQAIGNEGRNESPALKLTLPLIKHLVMLHQGNFSMEAVYGKGTTFTIELPYDRASEVKKEKEVKLNYSNVIPFPSEK